MEELGSGANGGGGAGGVVVRWCLVKCEPDLSQSGQWFIFISKVRSEVRLETETKCVCKELIVNCLCLNCLPL